MFVPLIIAVLVQLVASEEFTVYTQESIRDDNGQKCFTGCSPTNECIINWKGEKRSCKTLNQPAPIYLTSQYKDSDNKYCLSNCGHYDGWTYEYCITSKDRTKWDYCSTNKQKTFLPSGKPQGYTSYKKKCTDQCSKGRDTYFWCHYIDDKGAQAWDCCAPTALPRIPVLPTDFQIGEKNKGKCEDFLRYDSQYEKPLISTYLDVPDNFVTNIADAIETIGSNALTQVKTVNEHNNPVESYAMVKIKEFMVPAVIRARITKDTIHFRTNRTAIPSTIERKIRQQMAGTTDGYEAGTLIGCDLGGPNAEYNLVPRAVSWQCDDWADMEEGIINWCRKTNGSVDILIVVFYRDEKTPIPKAFGVSKVFRNSDNSVFVDCRERVFWNNF